MASLDRRHRLRHGAFMVKLVFLCRRRADISHERYSELLLSGHVPIALEHHPAMRRYVVNIVEQSPAGRQIVERDVAGFMGGADAYVTTEHVQRAPSAPPAAGARAPGVKLVCPVVRRNGMSHAEFVAHWLTRHVPLALQHHPGMIKYVTNVVDRRLGDSGAELDGIAELHFPSAQALATAMFDSPDGERIIRDDIPRFIGRTAAYRVAEYPQR